MKLILEVTLDGRFDATGAALGLLEDLINDLKKVVPLGRRFSEITTDEKMIDGAMCLCFSTDGGREGGEEKSLNAVWVTRGDIADGRKYSKTIAVVSEGVLAIDPNSGKILHSHNPD